MIIIINGPYGVGKTTVTKNLIKKIPSSILFDTERLGFFLYDLIPDNKKCDWIEIDLWKQFVVDVGLFVKKEYMKLTPLENVIKTYGLKNNKIS